MTRPPLTPCIICEKAVIYLWSEDIIAGSEATNLASASNIEIYSSYGSNFDTMSFAGIICDDCMDKLVQSKRVRVLNNSVFEE